MSEVHLRVEQIDHVELVVPDRKLAADWYCRMFGMEIVPEFQSWADDPNGPLMITTSDSKTKLALFQGDSNGSKHGVGFHLVAFRVDGQSFLEFIDDLDQMSLTDQTGSPVTREMIKDHQLAFSVYFCDPWKNELEITTYNHEIVRSALRSVIDSSE